jgi:hypothetical protein
MELVVLLWLELGGGVVSGFIADAELCACVILRFLNNFASLSFSFFLICSI